MASRTSMSSSWSQIASTAGRSPMVVTPTASSGCGPLRWTLAVAACTAVVIGVLVTLSDSPEQLPAWLPKYLPPRPEWLPPTASLLPRHSLPQWQSPELPQWQSPDARRLLPTSWLTGSPAAIIADPTGLTAALICAALVLVCLAALVRVCRRRPSLVQRMRALEAREQQAFRELRVIRTQLSAIRTEVAARTADAEARGLAKATAREARARSRARLVQKWCRCLLRAAPASDLEQARSLAKPPEESIDVVPAGPGSKLKPPRDEARAIHDLLAQGKLLVFRLVRSSARPRDTYEYLVLDPSQLQPPPVSTGRTSYAEPSQPSLQQAYSAWRAAFSLATGADEWDAALDGLQEVQRSRFVDALSLLDLDHSGGAVVALLRLHNLPNEFAQPLKFGDLLVAWSPQRDGGDLSFAERATCNMSSVMALNQWCSRHGATAQHTLLKDAAATAQNELADLHFETLFRKLFQVSRVGPGRRSGAAAALTSAQGKQYYALL